MEVGLLSNLLNIQTRFEVTKIELIQPNARKYIHIIVNVD